MVSSLRERFVFWRYQPLPVILAHSKFGSNGNFDHQ
jgi:hypothetical protein